MTSEVRPKKPPGRPKKPASERLEQFSIRLPPKLKYGLDLLARAQRRSLSQAVEWTLQGGLRDEEVARSGGKKVTIEELVNDLWEISEPNLRLIALWKAVPELVDFEDRVLCELVSTAIEKPDVANMPVPKELGSMTPRMARYRLHDLLTAEYWQFVCAHWVRLRSVAEQLAQRRKPVAGLSLVEVLKDHKYPEIASSLTRQLKSSESSWLQKKH